MPSVTAVTLENAIYTLLATTPGLSALVGTDIFPDVAPQDTEPPFTVYTIISDNCQEYMSGDAGINEARVQIDSYATSSSARGVLANLLKSALDGLISTVAGGVAISSMFQKDNKRSAENPKNESDTKLYRAMQEFTVWYYDPVTAGGGGSPVDNSIPHAWSYGGGQLTFPFTAGGVSSGAVTPQLYDMTYTDVNGIRWVCSAGATAWVIVNTVAQ